MANGYSPKEVQITSNLVLATPVDQAVTDPFVITAGGAIHGLLIEVEVTAASGSSTLTLDQRIGGQWVAVKSVTVSAAGGYAIRLLAQAAADQPHMPLSSVCRVRAVVTGVNSLTVKSISVNQPL